MVFKEVDFKLVIDDTFELIDTDDINLDNNIDNITLNDVHGVISELFKLIDNNPENKDIKEANFVRISEKIKKLVRKV